MKKYKFIIFFLIVMGLILPTGTGFASGSPMEQLKKTIDEFIAVLRDPQYTGNEVRDKRREILRDIIHDQFDFVTMTKGCLGTHRKKFNSDQINKIADVNGRIMELFYINRVEAYTNEEVKFIKEVVKRPDKLVDVFTEITSENIEPVPITYRLMKNKKGEWKIVNVTVVDVNWVNLKRSDWGKVLRRTSFDEFMEKLNQSLEKMKNAKPAA